MGQVREQAGTWSYCLWDRAAKKRTPYQKLPGVTSKRLAESIMRERQLDLDQTQSGLKTSSLRESSVTFRKAATKVSTDSALHVKPAWAKVYALWTARWINMHTDMPIEDYTPEHAHAYIATRRREFIEPQDPKKKKDKKTPKKHVSESTIIKEVAFLSRIFKRFGNPIFQNVRRPAEPKGELHFLSPEQFASLIAAAPPDRAFRYAFLVFTGARRGESWKITWQHIDLKHKTITIHNAAKGAGPRYPFRKIPIPNRLLPLLEDRKDDPTVPLFPVHNNWRRELLADCSKAKIEPCRIHDLRHTYASWLVQNGVSLHSVRDLMGHTSVTTTERYAHLAPDANHLAVAVLDAVEIKTPAKIEEIG